jgi:excisionase family DNA binding protein
MSASQTTGVAYLKVEEAAELCRVSPCTIRRAIARRLLTCLKPNGRMGRVLIRPSDIEAWMERSAHYAVGDRP